MVGTGGIPHTHTSVVLLTFPNNSYRVVVPHHTTTTRFPYGWWRWNGYGQTQFRRAFLHALRSSTHTGGTHTAHTSVGWTVHELVPLRALPGGTRLEQFRLQAALTFLGLSRQRPAYLPISPPSTLPTPGGTAPCMLLYSGSILPFACPHIPPTDSDICELPCRTVRCVAFPVLPITHSQTRGPQATDPPIERWQLQTVVTGCWA